MNSKNLNQIHQLEPRLSTILWIIVIVPNGKNFVLPTPSPALSRHEALLKKRRLALFNQSKKDELLKRPKPNVSFSPAILGNDDHTSGVMEMPLDNVVLSTPAAGMPLAVEPPRPILTLLTMKDWRSFNVELYRKAVQDNVLGPIHKSIEKFYAARSFKQQLAAVLPINHTADLTMAGINKMHTKMGVLEAFFRIIKEQCAVVGASYISITDISEMLATGKLHSAQIVRDWALDFLKHGGVCRGLEYKRRNKTSLIHDEAARLEMIRWLLVATRNIPTCYAKDFTAFIKLKYGVTCKK